MLTMGVSSTTLVETLVCRQSTIQMVRDIKPDAGKVLY
jgi:hypothetical protein